jgi:hypothetical protein
VIGLVVLGAVALGGVVLRIGGLLMVAVGVVSGLTSPGTMTPASRVLMIVLGAGAWLLGHVHWSWMYRETFSEPGEPRVIYRPYKSPLAALLIDLLGVAWRCLAGVSRVAATRLGRFVLSTSRRGPQTTVPERNARPLLGEWRVDGRGRGLARAAGRRRPAAADQAW